MTTPRVGEWWTTNKRGEGMAHRVGAVLPDLAIQDPPLAVAYNYSNWLPLCECRYGRESAGSATLFSTPDNGNEHCATCTTLSGAIDRWIKSQGPSADDGMWVVYSEGRPMSGEEDMHPDAVYAREYVAGAKWSALAAAPDRATAKAQRVQQALDALSEAQRELTMAILDVTP